MATIDSFAKVTAAPTQVKRLDIWLTVEEGVDEATGLPVTNYSARFEFPQLDASGNIVQTRSGNLIPHLSGAQKLKQKEIMDDLLLKAKGSV